MCGDHNDNDMFTLELGLSFEFFIVLGFKRWSGDVVFILIPMHTVFSGKKVSVADTIERSSCS